MSKVTSYVLHALAGALIVGAPILLMAVPLSWQSETIGALMALAFKWAHDYVGY